MRRAASASFSIRVDPAAPRPTGLEFPSNGEAPSDALVAFQFDHPEQDGLPIWGPRGAGATYIWKLCPRQQTGYYATFWWSNGGDFTWRDRPDTYYGCHPYPTTRNARGVDHNWEIATDAGLDIETTRAGTAKVVRMGRWVTQALRVTRNAFGSKTLVFYTELPSVAEPDVIEHTLPAAYGETNPPHPMITVGDSPWFERFQHERLSGVIRGFKFFHRVLSEADMLAEAASEGLATPAGRANIWWKKINPTPDDLLCEAGTGRNPRWAGSARAALWVG